MGKLSTKKHLKFFIFYTCFTAIMLGLCITANAETKNVKNGWLAVEVENLNYDNTVLRTIKDENASGGVGLEVNAESISDASELENPSFRIDYNVETSGTYNVWLRAYYKFDGTNQGTNMFVDLNGNGEYQPTSLWFRESDGNKGTYTWIRLGDVKCSEGTNRINFKYRRNSVIFDKLVITNDSSFNPTINPKIGAHPRLFVTETELPGLIEKVHDPLIAKSYEAIQKSAQTTIDCKLPDGDNDFTSYYQYNDIIIAKAFMYLIGEADENTALEAIGNIRDFINTVTFDKSNSTYATRYMGDTMLAAACVYDWCYDKLTAEDKQSILEGCLRIAGETEVGYPPVKRGYVTSHGIEDLIYLHQLSISIAVFDEYPEWYKTVSDTIFSVMAPAKKFLNSSGTSLSSWAYGQSRNNGSVHAEKMFTALGMDNSVSMFGEKYPDFYYMYIYGRLPNGVYFKEGDDYFWNRYKVDNRNTMMGSLFRYIGGTYNNPILQQQGALDFDWSGYNLSPIDIIMSDFNHTKKDPTSLPMTRFTVYPMSTMIARTSWHDGLNAPTAMAYVNMRDITVGDHQHRDIGAFQFYYKGMLAIDSGYYEYGEHFYNYQERSVAHNTMLIDDPNEPPYETYAHDGGQYSWRQFGETKTFDDIFKESKITAESKAKYAGPSEYKPEFSYISSDISKAYTDKVEAFERSCVFLNLEDEDYPAALIVYDNLKSKDASFKKTWLLHSEEEPEVDTATNTTVIKRTQEGYNGKLVNKTLLPTTDNSEITKIGGEGQEYLVDGINYDVNIPEGISADAGNWRIELSPQIASQEDKFLNVMYVCDADSDLPQIPAYEESGTGYIGATIKDRMVTFSSSRDNISGDVSLNVVDRGYENVKVLMTDMASGKWKISGNGTEAIAESKNGEFCLSFDAKPGTYTVSKIEDNAVVTTSKATQKKETFGDFYIRKNNNLMYLAKPTKLVDTVPYVAIDGIFTQINDTKILEKTDTSITLRNNGNTMIINANDEWYQLNGEKIKLEKPIKVIDGEIYSAIEGFESFLGVKNVSYSEYASLLKFTTIEQEPMPVLKSLENAVYTTADNATVEVYLPDECTEASIKVGDKGDPIAITSTGYIKVTIPLEGCAGTNVPIFLKYIADGIENSVSTTIGQIKDAGCTKVLCSTNFENAANNKTDNFEYADGTLGTDSAVGIAESSAGNKAWKAQLNTIDGKGQTNIIYRPSPVLDDEYYIDIDFDVYAEKQNYRLSAFLRAKNGYPNPSGWLEYTPNLSNYNWHSVKYRVYPHENIVHVYSDGIYESSVTVENLDGYSQIGVGLRMGYPSGVSTEPGAVYIDNLKVTAGMPKYKDFTAKMNINSKTVSASFVGGSDAEGRDLGKLIIAAYDNDGKLVGCKQKPITATANMLDTYKLENTFSAPFTSAKAFLWSNDNNLCPLLDAIDAVPET